MSCFVPFNSRNIDISIFAFKPTVVLVDELIESLKRFSVCTENLGCVQSSIFKSIHGNLILWYGGWMKKSTENKEVLIKTLVRWIPPATLSMLTSMSSMAILTEHSFFDSYAGESKEGSNAAKFSNGDIISLNLISSPCFSELQDVTYANLALFRSRFSKMDGATSGVCLKCHTMPMVACLYVWKSLLHCYSWILTSDFRKTELPYLDRFSPSVKYDIFWVVYVQESGGKIKN